MLRFERAAELLVPTMAGGGPAARVPCTLSDVATCGYADHAHLDREFRALAGCTPSEYLGGWR